MLALIRVHPHRASAVLGALALSDAPRYETSAHTPAFHTAVAVVGILLILPWFWRLVTRSRSSKSKPSVAQRRTSAWSAWWTLLLVAVIFAVATVAEASIYLLAPLSLCTFGLLLTVVCTSTGTALAMLRQDHPGPLRCLQWLTITPACLLGLTLSFLLFGDSWVTLLFGCFSTGLGALLCDLWAPTSQSTAAPASKPLR
jgi:cytochrome b561